MTRGLVAGSIALLGALALPLLVTDPFLVHTMIIVLMYAVLASSLNLVVGYVGQLSLAHAAFLGIGAYWSAIMTVEYAVDVWVAMATAGVVAALAGLVIGAITLRLEGHYFVLITLAFAEVLRLVALNWVEVTRGPLGFPNIPAPSIRLGALSVDFGSKVHFYYVILGVLLACLYVIYRFVHSNMGRAAVAIRENRQLAQSVGINPFRYALLAFVIGAFFAGCAGAFYAHYITYVGPEVFGFAFTVSMLIMIVVGGKATITGPLVGAAIIAVLLEELRFAKEIRLSIFGLLLMLCVLFFPNGLVRIGAARRLRRAAGSSATGDASGRVADEVAPTERRV
jgi:branched-chain amino acid transport system permease protein